MTYSQKYKWCDTSFDAPHSVRLRICVSNRCERLHIPHYHSFLQIFIVNILLWDPNTTLYIYMLYYTQWQICDRKFPFITTFSISIFEYSIIIPLCLCVSVPHLNWEKGATACTYPYISTYNLYSVTKGSQVIIKKINSNDESAYIPVCMLMVVLPGPAQQQPSFFFFFKQFRSFVKRLDKLHKYTYVRELSLVFFCFMTIITLNRQ